MKTMKKVLSLTLVLSMVLGLMTAIPVQAEGTMKWLEVIPLEIADGDAITISMDVTVTKENENGMWIIFSSPIDEDRAFDVQDSNRNDETQFRITPYGGFRYRNNGQWIPEDGSGSLEAENVDFSDMKPHNVKLRLYQKAATRWGEWYVDDVFVDAFNTQTSNPLRNIGVLGYDTDGLCCDINVKSYMNSIAGGLAAEVSSVDEANKQIVVDFSEAIGTTELLSQAVLKNTDETNGTDSVPLSLLVSTGATAVYNYDGELDPSSQYAIVFPKNIKSVNHNKPSYTQTVLSENIVYFNMEDETVYTDENFETGAAGFWSTRYSDAAKYRIKTEEDGWVANIYRLLANAEVMEMQGYTLPTGNIQKISVDIKPMVDNVDAYFEIMPTSSYQFGLGYSNGYVVSNMTETWSQAGWLNLAGYPFNAGSDIWMRKYLLGSYKTGEWNHWDFVLDINTKEFEVYKDYNLVQSFTVHGTFAPMTKIRFWAPNAGVAGTEMFRIDNLKISSLKGDVKDIRFTDEAGKEFGALGTLTRPLKSAKIVFNTKMDETSLSGGIKLMQGGQEIPCDAVYDATAYTYTLTPTVETLPNQPITAEIDVKSGDAEEIKYKASVNSGKFVEAWVNFIDVADGTKDPAKLTVGKTYSVNAFGTSYTNLYNDMQIFVAQYNGNGNMIDVKTNGAVIQAEKGVATGIYATDEIPLSFTVLPNATHVNVYIWTSGLNPWGNVGHLKVEAPTEAAN